ncbi:hypothetical protein E4O03_10395 [Treponema sp. OMZ 792]|uniref:hypothetical protein n=1 Tax=unclassified Treponema TaxID=2638727 RepID=UPI0020A3CA5B|nr:MULTISPECIES: hypothetical protein [unclassified Treponema]UTC74608.1 hypothetical protein E4O03_10395 [Treponema sp. OMZ 792]UTC77115.1 DUF2802 domain-containing protein [Treponema sp. OMZ 799]UTC81005.1 DUF2802 domain-containing protein [Treponema sp. OMZ 798]
MMTIIAIVLLILNLLMMFIFYLKLKNQFSDRASVNNIKNETQKLVAQIAFQTDQSVTIMEDKIKEVNGLMSELDKRILLTGREEEKRSAAERVYQSLAETAKANALSGFDPEVLVKTKKPVISNENLRDTSLSEQVSKKENSHIEDEPIKIYTKQILAPKAGIVPDQTASMKEQIIEMAKKGLSIELIAEKIPLPTGEIELIISMNT